MLRWPAVSPLNVDPHSLPLVGPLPQNIPSRPDLFAKLHLGLKTLIDGSCSHQGNLPQSPDKSLNQLSTFEKNRGVCSLDTSKEFRFLRENPFPDYGDQISYRLAAGILRRCNSQGGPAALAQLRQGTLHPEKGLKYAKCLPEARGISKILPGFKLVEGST